MSHFVDNAPEIDKLYSKLVKEYNKDQWSKIASLDRFLRIKRDAAYDAGNLHMYNMLIDVIFFADNDY